MCAGERTQAAALLVLCVLLPPSRPASVGNSDQVGQGRPRHPRARGLRGVTSPAPTPQYCTPFRIHKRHTARDSLPPLRGRQVASRQVGDALAGACGRACALEGVGADESPGSSPGQPPPDWPLCDAWLVAVSPARDPLPLPGSRSRPLAGTSHRLPR